MEKKLARVTFLGRQKWQGQILWGDFFLQESEGSGRKENIGGV